MDELETQAPFIPFMEEPQKLPRVGPTHEPEDPRSAEPDLKEPEPVLSEEVHELGDGVMSDVEAASEAEADDGDHVMSDAEAGDLAAAPGGPHAPVMSESEAELDDDVVALESDGYEAMPSGVNLYSQVGEERKGREGAADAALLGAYVPEVRNEVSPHATCLHNVLCQQLA